MQTYAVFSANSSLGINLLANKILFYPCQTLVSLASFQQFEEMGTNFVIK